MQRPLAGLTRRNVGRELLAGVTLLAIAAINPKNLLMAAGAGLSIRAAEMAVGAVVVVIASSLCSRHPPFWCRSSDT